MNAESRPCFRCQGNEFTRGNHVVETSAGRFRLSTKRCNGCCYEMIVGTRKIRDQNDQLTH